MSLLKKNIPVTLTKPIKVYIGPYQEIEVMVEVWIEIKYIRFFCIPLYRSIKIKNNFNDLMKMEKLKNLSFKEKDVLYTKVEIMEKELRIENINMWYIR